LVYHKAVLVREVLYFLSPQPGGIYVDATFGGGGHSRAILAYEPGCRVIGVDWDKKALELNARELEEEYGERFKTIWGNFAALGMLLKREGIGQVNGILADFGTSQYQISQRPGFSFARDTWLDMRMSPAHQRTTAYDIVNRATERELIDILGEYGQEHRAHKIARALVEARRKRPISTTNELVQVLGTVLRIHGYHKIHPTTKVFQALRIAVNRELDNIHALLVQSPRLLAPGGHLVCISFQSLEDGMVKRFFREHTNQFTLLTPKAVTPDQEELLDNPSARSARLRAAVLKEQ
jgi:16S rRNA (cytosine1402-N4)-methyltransferase